jgi:hypothetical protein
VAAGEPTASPPGHQREVLDGEIDVDGDLALPVFVVIVFTGVLLATHGFDPP